ncbi:hypothetical protein [Salmonella phage Lumpael]|uniref:Uncharacterized protein n=1 Tax=Salmonella phage Lumpael TaxID=2488859 RepID=A0A3G8F328_9CAUD|nr:hypothetical protein HOU68_gp06 [Salmonella phage Lumpael]AZF88753.1 hypothetical protein [Salmonella phage Lumpael]
MFYELIASYLTLGVAYIIMECKAGAAAYLGRKMAEEVRAIPPSLIPLVAFIVALLAVLVLAVTLVIWPYFAWHDWRNGTIFKAGRYDGME